MEKNFCEELKEVYKNKLFDNPTINYCVNGFMEALGINHLEGEIKPLGFQKIIDNENNKYVGDIVEKKAEDYKIKVVRSKGKKKDWLKISGNVDNVQFSMSNYYSERDLEHGKIKFNVVINVSDNEKRYSMKFFNEYGMTFCICKREDIYDYYVDKIDFVLLRNDFEIVLTMIMQFIQNPDYAINMYKMMQSGSFFVETKKIYSNNDIILDKNGKKYVKVFK